jgi:hypothetical protein
LLWEIGSGHNSQDYAARPGGRGCVILRARP